MRRALPALALAAALSLGACGGGLHSAGDVAVKVEVTISQVEADYRVARAIVDAVAPLLPADKAAKIAQLEAKADQALAVAHAAATVAEQVAALEQATAAVDQLQAVPAP